MAALGIVFGDIGTSVLYAFRESFHGRGLAATPENVLGILSLIVWSLTLVVSVKYLLFVMRADNHGEGGILALTALITTVQARRAGSRWLLTLLGLFGAALVYGDGVITPAITVLAAVEGLDAAAPAVEQFVLPLAVGILIALFSIQGLGTSGVGRLFGPVMFTWFVLLGLLGVSQMVRQPDVLWALDPLYGARFLWHHGAASFAVLGSVVLAVTGAEALYADMGHFGRWPIRLGWFGVAFPALLLNYFGQGALMLSDPRASGDPFFLMAPAWALYPLVGIATLAAIIASQSLITGAFSLSVQSVQLGYLPRLDIRHTSPEAIGQVYVPTVNWLLMLVCVGLVLAFRTSSNLAAAYGVAVTMTMTVTTLLFYVVSVERFRWPRWFAAPLVVLLLTIDVAFMSANLLKIPNGGWFPLAVAAIVFTLMTTWKRGRRIVSERLGAERLTAAEFVERIRRWPPHRVPGTGIYFSSHPFTAPAALLHNFRHARVLHVQVLFLTVETADSPYVHPEERAEVVPLGEGIYQVVLRYGFSENPNVPRALKRIEVGGRGLELGSVTYFVGRETLLPTRGKGMAIWRERLFALMARNAQTATAYLRLPPDQVVEIGVQIEL